VRDVLITKLCVTWVTPWPGVTPGGITLLGHGSVVTMPVGVIGV